MATENLQKIACSALEKNFHNQNKLENEFVHIPVMLKEVINMITPADGKVYFDGTFGGGGYSRAILEACNCKVIACDRDPYVNQIAMNFLKNFNQRFAFLNSKFSEIEKILTHFNIKKVDGIVLDLGVSNFQLMNAERGFSFKLNGPLDMEMGLCSETALDVINKYSEQELADIIFHYGEERFSRRIAKNIKLNLKKIKNTADLAEIIRKCVRRVGKIDPATKTFQALRIFVNDELEELQRILEKSVNLLNSNGKIIVVSFHSLEDRIVKLFFRELIKQKKENRFVLINKKPIVPSENEILRNPKSRSAKLRGISML